MCAAICKAVPSNAAGQMACAWWLVEAGALTCGDVVTLLDSGVSFLHMAHDSTKGTGVRLLQWSAVLAACKKAA